MSADLVALEAERRGVHLFRFNTEDYPVGIRLAAIPVGKVVAHLFVDERVVDLGGTRGIWLRRPRWPVVDRALDREAGLFAQQEAVAAIGGVWRTLADRCVSPPDAMQAARWKVAQLAVASRLGFPVPDSVVTNDPGVASSFLAGGRSVAKAVAEARVETADRALVGEAFELLTEAPSTAIRTAPVLLQRLVDKVADIRVTVVGRQVYAVRITVPAGSPLDFRQTDPGRCVYEVVELAPTLRNGLLGYLDHFGLRYGAFDLAEDRDATLWFLECNPAGQWGWLEPPTGLRITAAILDLLLDPSGR